MSPSPSSARFSSPLVRVLLAQGLSSIGTSVSTVALAVMVFELTGSVLHMGAVLAASTMPVVLVAFFGGALLDRYGGRTIMVLADVFRAAFIALMPFAAEVSVGYIYVISVGLGSFSALFNPAQVKLVGELAGRQKLMQVNSYLSIAREGCELGGYLIGGLLVATLGYRLTFAVDATSYVASGALLLSLTRLPSPPAEGVTLPRLLRETPSALSTLWRKPALRTNMLLALLPMTAVLMTTPNSYGLALQVFDKGPQGLAYMEVITALGWVVGGVVASRLVWPGDRNTYVALSVVSMSVCFALVSFSPFFWLSVGLLAAATTANVGAIVGSMTLFQEIEDRPDKGRLITLRSGLGQLSATLGLLAGGVLGDLLGIRGLFLFVGVAATGLAALVVLPYRLSLRQAEGGGLAEPQLAMTDRLLPKKDQRR